MPFSLISIPVERLHELLECDPDTGTLTWRRKRLGIKRNRQAGHRRKDGYWIIGIERKEYLVHRVIWAMSHGEWPVEEIDHANGDPSDNRLRNLRPATHSQNIFSQRISTRNRSGYIGVSWSKQKQKWWAKVGLKHVGFFDRLEDAAMARRLAAKHAFGEFARNQ